MMNLAEMERSYTTLLLAFVSCLTFGSSSQLSTDRSKFIIIIIIVITAVCCTSIVVANKVILISIKAFIMEVFPHEALQSRSVSFRLSGCMFVPYWLLTVTLKS